MSLVQFFRVIFFKFELQVRIMTIKQCNLWLVIIMVIKLIVVNALRNPPACQIDSDKEG